ncbi:hypothetical protein V6N13_111851 [Hibiscus sabdariffa]|uniref:Uncharacterized protein n=1 Tax=Hibiscus sabdariffa TaxID=183260 RepID=A0ABR2TM16_9ROSI
MSTVGFDSADFPVLSAQPSLERPASPVGAEDQRTTKKVKNKGVEDGVVVDGSKSAATYISGLIETVDVSMQEEDGVATQTMQVDGNEGSHGLPNSCAVAVAGPRASKASTEKF